MQDTRKFRLLAVVTAVLTVMMAAVSVSSGAPASPGSPSVQTTCVDSPSATSPTTVGVPVRIDGLADMGAAAYTMLLEAPSGASFPAGSSAGSEFNAWCTGLDGVPRFVRTDIADDENCGAPHTVGTNCWQIDVFCFADALSGGVQPTINSTLNVLAPVGTHNLTIIPELVNGTRSRVFDSAGGFALMDPINNATPTVVIGNTCGPTAVTMSGFDATTDSPAPFAAAAWPLLVGAAAVAAGGAYALLRRKR